MPEAENYAVPEAPDPYARIAELEAALRTSELVLTALAMADADVRAIVCSTEHLTETLNEARKALRWK